MRRPCVRPCATLHHTSVLHKTPKSLILKVLLRQTVLGAHYELFDTTGNIPGTTYDIHHTHKYDRRVANYKLPTPLKRAPQQIWVFRFFGLGPGGSEGPREAPQSPPWAFPGPPGASRRPPGPKTNKSKKHRNLKELIKQWS